MIGTVVGFLIVGVIGWGLVAGRYKVIASRRYDWKRDQDPDLKAFSAGSRAKPVRDQSVE